MPTETASAEATASESILPFEDLLPHPQCSFSLDLG